LVFFFQRNKTKQKTEYQTRLTNIDEVVVEIQDKQTSIEEERLTKQKEIKECQENSKEASREYTTVVVRFFFIYFKSDLYWTKN